MMTRFFALLMACFSLVVLSVSAQEDGGITGWALVGIDNVSAPVGYEYEVDSNGYFANRDVYLYISSDLSGRVFENTYPVALAPWLDQTLAYTDAPSIGPLEYPYPCSSGQTSIGLFDLSDLKNDQFCLNTPFLNPSETLAPLQRNPFDVNLIFAANRYLIDLQAESITDIS
ncbi:MAG: hypothetical protein H6672_22140, partial [Anaerolineaceae bacterium]|nr:hypothetical protein [Anaerolineaceae bacterium]